MSLERRKEAGQAWETVVADSGGSQTLEQVLTAGDDAGGLNIQNVGQLFISELAVDTLAGGDMVIGADSLKVTADALHFFSNDDPVSQPNVPLTTPSVQDVIDALVALGLVEQSD
jgi:hypothetical protein